VRSVGSWPHKGKTKGDHKGGVWIPAARARPRTTAPSNRSGVLHAEAFVELAKADIPPQRFRGSPLDGRADCLVDRRRELPGKTEIRLGRPLLIALGGVG
jgi:hypothetical protein